MGAAATDDMLGNRDLTRFDALIVGSGAGGSTAAHVLSAAGFKVLVLEAGCNPFPGLDQPGRIPWPLFSNDEIKNSVRRWIYQDPLVEPRTFRRTAADPPRPHPDVNLLTRNVGGAAVISTVSYPRFTAVDFRMASALRAAGRDVSGASFADWPVSYDELEPFYVETERLTGIAGTDVGPDADPFASPRSGRFPLPPQPEMYVGRVLANGARRLGYHPFNYPSGILTQPYDGRTPCVSCGFCSGSGCPRNSKGSPAVTTLRRALLSGNCQLRFNSHASRLVMNADQQRVLGVEYVDGDGVLQSAAADHVILAASPIESVRLCWLSDPQNGIGNGGDQLGRHIMFHFQTITAGFFRQRLHGERGRSVTNGMSDFRGITVGGADLADDRPVGGVIEFSTSSEPIIAAREALASLPLAENFGVSLKDLLADSVFQQHIAVMIMQGEDAPQATNRVELDPNVRDVYGLRVPCVTYANHDFELGAAEFYRPKMLEVMGAAGAEFALTQPTFAGDPPVSRHVLGGLRMGMDSSDSVCDRFGKFHGIDNLYCADGSVCVTGSGYNPTPTIIALALRTAGAIVHPGAPERILA